MTEFFIVTMKYAIIDANKLIDIQIMSHYREVRWQTSQSINNKINIYIYKYCRTFHMLYLSHIYVVYVAYAVELSTKYLWNKLRHSFTFGTH